MQTKQIWLYITLLFGTSFGSSPKKCLDIQVSISQKVEYEGFHREINWLVESDNFDKESWDTSQCKACLQLDVPAGMFVNPDQISDMNRVGEIQAYIEGDVDVELHSNEADGHKVYVYLPSDGLEKVSVQLPVHLRYQRAAIAGGFGKVILPKPSFLVHCPPHGEFRVCGKHPKLDASCDMHNSNQCIWRNLTYHAFFDEVQLFVPIGDLDDYPFVSIVTLLLGCAGSIYVLSVLSSMPL